jgi:uncharacterized protein (TIGR03083 family)
MDRLGIITTEAARLATALSGVDPARRCPTCPDWSAADLLWHLTNVHFFWAGILSRGALSEADLPAVEESKPDRPEAFADLLTLRRQATAALVAELARRDDAEPFWSWLPPDQTVGYTRRKQTSEATMHRVDAELTAGLPVSPIADEVAAGAVDHAVDVMWGWMPEAANYQPRHVVELVATDTGETWRVEVGEWSTAAGTSQGLRTVRATTGEPSATVRASVCDLALWAWTRGDHVERSGQPATLAALDRLLSEGIQ